MRAVHLVERDLCGARLLPPGPDPPPSATILVVEDNDALRLLVTLALTDAGYTVVAVAGGADALTIATACPEIQLVLVDGRLPDRHGADVARELADTLRGVPIICMSGDGGEFASVPAGTRLLPKPFSLAALVASVRESLDEAVARARFAPRAR